ncbi:MAG TPA: AMP-binding protein [Acidimicrobiales bacterium]|nr:AMP-binding protein [Acidimicrobiales bacterium]
MKVALPGALESARKGVAELRFATSVASRIGLVGRDGLRLVPAIVSAGRKWGTVPAAGYEPAAGAFGDAVGLIDDCGSLTFNELRAQSNAIAVALGERGIGEGDKVALLVRNHRWLPLTTAALGKLGADGIFLNTGFSAPQAVEVTAREGAVAVIADEEYEPVVGGIALPRYLAWTDDEAGAKVVPTLAELADEAAGRVPPKPGRAARTVILTSGTTGTPKGASRGTENSTNAALGFLDLVPLKVRDTTLVAAPGFHAWGAAHLASSLLLASTVILQRRFDPEAVLAGIAEHRVRTLVVVPVMLQRMLDLPGDVRAKYDTSSLEVVASSGSALPGPLAHRWMDAFGENLYNCYGSTEVAMAAIATPTDLRAGPGTAGRPPHGTTVALLDESGREVAAGETGRIFVGSDALFEGYTGGGNKEVIDGLMSTGDVGHFDTEGRLFVEGRADDMIVSGGENVYPAEIEDLLAALPDVADVAVVGVADDEFGQRLAAFIVKRPGATLSEQDVKAAVKSGLANYKVPRDVTFLDELPRNATGKILRRELKPT